MNLNAIDFSIIAIYFASVLAIGLLIARREKYKDKNHQINDSDYFLAGKSLGWIAIGSSLFASNISSTTLIGLSGAAYLTGVSISSYEWMASVVLIFFAIFFIPYYVGKNIFTMPQFLENRYDGRLRSYFSILTVVGNIFIDTAGTLYAGSLVVKFFFPEIEFWQSATLLAIIAGVYTAAGGLAAVVYTDIIQAVILMVGSFIITFLTFEQISNWSDFLNATPEKYFSVIQPRTDQVMPWTGLVFGVPVLGFYFWCTNQFIVQRVLGAKSIDHARWGSLFAGLLKLPVLFFMVYPGLMARNIFPDLSSPDLVFPTLVNELLPIGIKGLVLAGLMAAIMSSIDSTLHSASTLITMDFVKKYKPNMTPQQLTKSGRYITLGFMVISILWVPVVASFETLFQYLQSALAYLVPPVVSVFILGLFWRGTTSRGAFWGMIISHIFSLITFLAVKQNYIGIHFLEIAGILTLFSSFLIILLSLYDPQKITTQQSHFTWSLESVKELEKTLPNKSWWQDYRLHSVILLLLTVWLVIAHW
ncbi:MAG: sodium:solute symporter [Bdellovibrionales bacterium]|nr:sodium:solute symporter [Bdellovibrionales bacterium]